MGRLSRGKDLKNCKTTNKVVSTGISANSSKKRKIIDTASDSEQLPGKVNHCQDKQTNVKLAVMKGRGPGNEPRSIVLNEDSNNLDTEQLGKDYKLSNHSHFTRFRSSEIQIVPIQTKLNSNVKQSVLMVHSMEHVPEKINFGTQTTPKTGKGTTRNYNVNQKYVRNSAKLVKDNSVSVVNNSDFQLQDLLDVGVAMNTAADGDMVITVHADDDDFDSELESEDSSMVEQENLVNTRPPNDQEQARAMSVTTPVELPPPVQISQEAWRKQLSNSLRDDPMVKQMVGDLFKEQFKSLQGNEQGLMSNFEPAIMHHSSNRNGNSNRQKQVRNDDADKLTVECNNTQGHKIVTSPSESTIYAPALNHLHNGKNNQIVDQISNFVENSRIQTQQQQPRSPVAMASRNLNVSRAATPKHSGRSQQV